MSYPYTECIHEQYPADKFELQSLYLFNDIIITEHYEFLLILKRTTFFVMCN